VPSGVTLVRRELETVLEQAEVDRARRPDIALVMSEAASNAVAHAYPPLAPGLLFVDAALARGHLSVRVCDCGRGFRARSDAAGSGLGMVLMSRFCDELEIASNRSVPGTRVSATFRDVAPELVPPPEPPAVGSVAEYAAALRAMSASLRADAQALLAYAEQALGHAELLRAER